MAELGIYFDLYSNLEKQSHRPRFGYMPYPIVWVNIANALIDVLILYSAAYFLYNQIRPKQQMIQTNTFSTYINFYFLCKAYALYLPVHFDLSFLMFILKILWHKYLHHHFIYVGRVFFYFVLVAFNLYSSLSI